MEIPVKAVIEAVSFCITVGWALYSARLLSLGGRGSLETSWKNLAIGAIATASGILVLTVDDIIGTPLLDILGSAIVAIGGIFMLFALRRQYSVWKSAFVSAKATRVSTHRLKASKAQEIQSETDRSPVAGPTVTGVRNPRRGVIEFDPASDYELQVVDYLRRMAERGTRIVLFTKQGSSLSTTTNAEIVLLSFADNGLKVSPDGHMSVFIGNPSLIVDALASVLNTDSGAVVTLDTVTDIILSLGLSRTYNLLWQMDELIGAKGSNASLLLLLNPKAHDKETCSLIEGFADAIFCTDKSGLRLTKGDTRFLS